MPDTPLETEDTQKVERMDLPVQIRIEQVTVTWPVSETGWPTIQAEVSIHPGNGPVLNPIKTRITLPASSAVHPGAWSIYNDLRKLVLASLQEKWAETVPF